MSISKKLYRVYDPDMSCYTSIKFNPEDGFWMTIYLKQSGKRSSYTQIVHPDDFPIELVKRFSKILAEFNWEVNISSISVPSTILSYIIGDDYESRQLGLQMFMEFVCQRAIYLQNTRRNRGEGPAKRSREERITNKNLKRGSYYGGKQTNKRCYTNGAHSSGWSNYKQRAYYCK